MATNINSHIISADNKEWGRNGTPTIAVGAWHRQKPCKQYVLVYHFHQLSNVNDEWFTLNSSYSMLANHC